MKTAVHLQTKFGYDLYCTVFAQFEQYKIQGKLSELKSVLFKERQETEQELLTFLNDDVMIRKYKMDDEDEVGWEFYKELADKYSTINYFYNRQA